MDLRTTVTTSWTKVDPAAWDALIGEGSPFLTHAYLLALEQTGVACPATGWHPRPILLWRGSTLVGGAPAWIVDHTEGQYVWQRHWHRALGSHAHLLEPKVVVGVPLTPVVGERLIVREPDPDPGQTALLGALDRLRGRHLAWHLFFCTERGARAAATRGAFIRTQPQFHWTQRGWENFDGFVQALTRRRRRTIQRERAALRDLSFDRVMAPEPELLELAWRCYADTAARHGDDPPRLSEAFFLRLGQTMSERLTIVVARDGPRAIGAALLLQGGDRLYGRYSGQLERRPFLHFELCYYQGIEHAIARGLSAFEPGHGGEHKLARGFSPTLVHSAHRFAIPEIHRAFAEHAERERTWVDEQVAELRHHDGYRRDGSAAEGG